MVNITRILRGGLVLAFMLSTVSCGGDSSDDSSSTGAVAAASNVVPVIVDSGPVPTTNPTSNFLYTTVTVCVPGSTTQCQTIDHIQIDTGSYGLRLLSPVLTLSLPVTVASDGNSLSECTPFVGVYSWGPVASADVQISGETASSVPIQVIGDPSFSAVPDACSSEGTAEDTVASFGANGVLGIGVFPQDCGSGCASNAANGIYYSCPVGGDCVGIEAPLNSQVLNPVPLFATDNNGTLIDLPAVASPGATTLTGSLIFGIDTQSNNASGSQSVLTVSSTNGEFTTVFNGQTLSDSFLDTGSNGIFFNDSSIVSCTDSGFANFYCPASPVSLSGTLTGLNNVTATVSFTVDNAQTVSTDDPTFAVLPTIAGTFTSDSEGFDWGLPFYYGRRVATAIQGYTTSVGTGPYVAF